MKNIVLTALSGLLGLARASGGIDAQAQQALSFAYMYGLPLYAYGNISKPILARMDFQPNVILADPQPNEPGGVGVVLPNGDTMYSILFIDLSSDDIVVTIPEMPKDRYWVFPICTPYGDNLVNLGNLDLSKPGDYLIQYDPNKYGLETTNVPEGFVGVIKYPMAYGLSNSRILTDRTEEDVALVAKLQLGFNVSRTIPRDGKPIAPPLNLTMFVDPAYNPSESLLYEEAVLKVAAALAPYTSPYVVADRTWVSEKLKKAGLDDGKFAQPNGTDLTAAANTATKAARAFSLKPGVRKNVGNNWFIFNEEYIGKFDSNYEMRYQICLMAYLALASSECVYPFVDEDLTVEEGESLLFTFTEPPRIRDGGFWSLTAYGPNLDLIPNDMKKYLVGDRSNLTFPDGHPVSEGEEKEFEVLLQASDINPPSNWTANWLPITPGNSTIAVTIRWYGAEEYMINGSYIHPEIKTINSIGV